MTARTRGDFIHELLSLYGIQAGQAPGVRFFYPPPFCRLCGVTDTDMLEVQPGVWECLSHLKGAA